MPVYAECGGLMYLGKCIRDFQGHEHQMVSSIPVSSRIDNHRLSLGYRTLEAMKDGPLMQKGQIVRGHEFHWSVLNSGPHKPNAYRVAENGGFVEGFQRKLTLASYVHLHMASLPEMALRFVENCRNFQKG